MEHFIKFRFRSSTNTIAGVQMYGGKNIIHIFGFRLNFALESCTFNFMDLLV